MIVKWKLLHPKMTEEHLGMLQYFLDDINPQPAKEQLHQNYLHGGGWQPFDKFKLLDDNAIVYPGDPPLKPLAQAQLHDHAWVAVIQPDRSFEICRMD